MCNQSGLRFGARCLTSDVVRGSDVLEVGARDVNGSLRSSVAEFSPATYLCIDLTPGRGVDVIMRADDLLTHFGSDAFDVVIATEVVEHVRDWRGIVQNLKAVLRPHGHLLVTTRSRGFPYHGWPSDYWRYEVDDMREIFRDMDILALEPDPEAPGVFVFATRPDTWVDRTPPLALYSIITRDRQVALSRRDMARYRIRRRLALIRRQVGHT